MATDYSKMRFLVVEDFDDMLRAIRQMLEAMGAKDIRLVNDGAAAIKAMESKPVDVVLCDYNLGDSKDGQQILEEARARGLMTPSTVFIMVTAETSIDMVLGAVDHKPDDYLTKPFNRNSLRMRLERVLANKAEFAAIDAAAAAGDLDAAIARCDDKLATRSRHSLEVMQRKGDLLVAAGRHDEALALYDEVLASRDLRWARLGRGICLYHQGRLDEAHGIFEHLVATNRLGMEAYDWLARVEEAQGRLDAAQEVLARATSISPKSVQRHKELGELAFRNADYDTAGKAYRSVVRLNRHSFYRSLSDHTRLAEALNAGGDREGALAAVREGRRVHQASPEEERRALLLEGSVLHDMGREKEARAVLESVAEAEGPDDARQASLEEARRLFARGDKDTAAKMLENLVRNNHEDEALLSDVRDAFAQAGLGAQGEAMVSATRDKLVRLNNQGVDLARAGKLEEAIALFRDAAEGMPANRVVNLNAAQVLVIRMREHGVEPGLLEEAGRYLARVAKLEPDNPKYLSVRNKLDQLAAGRG